MTVIVTSNVPDRYRGFLASISLEIAPGVYTAPDMNKGVRERVWETLSDWHSRLKTGSVVMTWRDTAHPAGQQVLMLGHPKKEIIMYEGHFLVRSESASGTTNTPIASEKS